MALILPNDIEADTSADAVELQQNFDTLENFLNTEVILRNGQVAMTAPLLLSGSPTSPNHAANKTYVDTMLSQTEGDARYVNLTGDTMSGNLIVGGLPNPDTAAPGVSVNASGGITVCPAATVGITTPSMVVGRGGSPAANTGGQFIRFDRGAAGIGSIVIASATSVAYNTTSDQRLKVRSGDVDDAATIVQALGPLVYRGRWIADEGEGKEWVFLNSQDVQPLCDFAVHGDPAGIDDDGKVIPQQLDHGSLVPLLIAALGQAFERIEALENA